MGQGFISMFNGFMWEISCFCMHHYHVQIAMHSFKLIKNFHRNQNLRFQNKTFQNNQNLFSFMLSRSNIDVQFQINQDFLSKSKLEILQQNIHSTLKTRMTKICFHSYCHVQTSMCRFKLIQIFCRNQNLRFCNETFIQCCKLEQPKFVFIHKSFHIKKFEQPHFLQQENTMSGVIESATE